MLFTFDEDFGPGLLWQRNSGQFFLEPIKNSDIFQQPKIFLGNLNDLKEFRKLINYTIKRIKEYKGD